MEHMVRLLGISEKTKFRFFVTFEAQKYQTDEGAHRYQQTTRIRKGFGPFKVAFRTDSHTWIECLAVGNIFQGQSHRASQRHSIHFSAKEMSRLLKDLLGKDCCMYRLGTLGRGWDEESYDYVNLKLEGFLLSDGIIKCLYGRAYAIRPGEY